MAEKSDCGAAKRVSKINATCVEGHARPHPSPLPQERENVSARLVKSYVAVAYTKFLARFEISQCGINYGHSLSIRLTDSVGFRRIVSPIPVRNE